MPLVSCPECHHQISDKAAACPNCGYPIPKGGPVSIEPRSGPIFHGDTSSFRLHEPEKEHPEGSRYMFLAAAVVGLLLFAEAGKRYFWGDLEFGILGAADCVGGILPWVALPLLVALIACIGFKRPFFKVLTFACLIIGVPLSAISTMGYFSRMEGQQEIAREAAADAARVNRLNAMTKPHPAFKQALDLGLVADWISKKDPETRAYLNQVLGAGSRSEFDHMVTLFDQEMEADLAAEHVAAIERAHPDWKEIFSSGRLDRWIDSKKGSERQRYLRIKEKGETSEVIDMFSQFKKENEQKKGL